MLLINLKRVILMLQSIYAETLYKNIFPTKGYKNNDPQNSVLYLGRPKSYLYCKYTFYEEILHLNNITTCTVMF